MLYFIFGTLHRSGIKFLIRNFNRMLIMNFIPDWEPAFEFWNCKSAWSPDKTRKLMFHWRMFFQASRNPVTKKKIYKKKVVIKNSAIERPCKVNLDKEAVVNANKNLSQHPSIWKIKETTNFSACYSFHTVSKEDILYQLHSLDPTKAMQKCDIPTNIMRKNYDIFSEFLFAEFNGIFWWQTLTSLFPEHLKYAGVKPAVTKDYLNDKNNYRPVTILSNISKIYERLFYK